MPEPAPDDEPAAPRGLRAAYQAAEEKIIELTQRLRSEGSLNLHTDTPDQIAQAVLDTVEVKRAERIARSMLRLVEERRQPRLFPDAAEKALE